MQHQKEVENVIGEWNLLGALMNDEVNSLSWVWKEGYFIHEGTIFYSFIHIFCYSDRYERK